MIVVIDFIAYDLPNDTFALKEFGLWSIAPDAKNNIVTSHYSFKPPYEWSKLPSEYQRTYEAHSKHHGIPWDKGTTPFNAMIPAIIDDLRHVTGIYVASAKAKVVLTELIGDQKEIAVLENLGWFDKNEVVKNSCNLHREKGNNCAYDNARRMSIWININQMIVDASGFEPTVSIMEHVDVNKR
ncbi:uncharacterized protein LOC141532690 [Cotesia typhae]|uniref:uncharacterized protein LOC141532690 n=1 Tax=Cotesia typhae TaxID=2053667 RepID=UPI003D687D94